MAVFLEHQYLSLTPIKNKGYIALIAQKYTGGHSTGAVSENIWDAVLCEYPDVDLPENIWAAAAWKVADHFDETSQNDCVVHRGSLDL